VPEALLWPVQKEIGIPFLEKCSSLIFSGTLRCDIVVVLVPFIRSRGRSPVAAVRFLLLAIAACGGKASGGNAGTGSGTSAGPSSGAVTTGATGSLGTSPVTTSGTSSGTGTSGSATVAALPPGALIATDIGQNGGTVGANGVTVIIPEGALTSDVTITIQSSTAHGPTGTVGEVFEIGPTGTQFAQPITIAFGYTDSELMGLPPSDFAVETSTDSGVSWTTLSQIVVDVYAHTIAGQTTHLSPYASSSKTGMGGRADG
jgi:hypothetical protein